MSLDENTNETANQAEEPNQAAAAPAAAPAAAAGNALAGFLALKESNPKVFYGAIGGAAVVLLALVFSGGSDPKLPVHQQKPLVSGQNYVLKSPNTYDPNATVRLVSVPGSLAAYDDTEENDRDGACKHMPMNTPVKLTQIQNDPSDKNLVWAEVEISASGECQGRRAWTSSINLQ
ncbi:hypothetical protein PL263_09165 [Methylomonas sp. EFPC3]|uniref:hypothetical protein n=1 Tax=unclassified Methylomonas TaxID=2608980 RepID=UPI002415BE3F|nr:hypothetical protein [Methylomonas sp. EFPC3]WFP52183.1 hypothetical protein PL263_09165 [Methylomonas sp. EFPC3]